MSKTFKTINPATEETIKEYSFISDAEADQAVKDCHQAFQKWKFTSFEERANKLKAIGVELKKNKTEFAKLMTKEMGKLISQGEQEIELCASICDYTAENGAESLKDEQRTLPNGGKGLITYSPLGVIYGIQPWNFPVYQVIRYTIANLMAGNGVLLKHAENVTGSALMIEKVLKDAGLPENLFKVILVDHDQSDKIIEHDLVRGVTFTGSAAGGKVVAKKAAENLKKTVLELGSNDAYIVLKDADLETAVKSCVNGRVYNNGETCVAAKRFIVEAEIYEDFKEAFVKKMKAIKFGDPTSNEANIGPMARKDLRGKLHDQVEKSVSKGAKILCGGEVPDQKGYYYPATVLDNLSPGMPAYDDELFGPVASLIKAEDEEDAFKIANASNFGLGGGIFTKDEEKAFVLAKKHFDTGMVFINSFGVAQPNMPFGGVKDSGYGNEHGGFGIREFVNAKAVMRLND